MVPKNVKGGNVKCKSPLGFNNFHSVAKYQKLEGGPFPEIKNVSKKVSER